MLVAVFAFAGSAPGAEAGVKLLDVPYLAQPARLCGGAAAAMVLRYWGEAEAAPEDFAGLLDKAAGGIRTKALADELRLRGWRAIVIPGTLEEIRKHLGMGRPILALLRVGGGDFHYVVLLGSAGGGLFLHDPAIGPFQTMDEQKFLKAWTPARRWGLLVLPLMGRKKGSGEDGTPKVKLESDPLFSGLGACQGLMDEGVGLAREGRLVWAEARLLQAAAVCPKEAGPVRELAGLRALENDWPAAELLAERAVGMDAGDRLAWRILATSRFLQDELLGALDAWNRLGQPAIDLLRVDGLARTRYAVIDKLLGLDVGTRLTPDRLLRARRRLAEAPSVSRSRVGYRPLGGGRTRVEAVVLERPLLLDGRLELVAMAVHALTDREVGLRLAAPTGNGEVWSAAGRWWEHRRRVELELRTPGAFGLGGVWRVAGRVEGEAFSAGELILEERRGAGLEVGDWASGWLHWNGGLRLEHWRGRGSSLSASGALEARWAEERLAGGVEALAGTGLEGGWGFTTAGAHLRWSSGKSSRTPARATLGVQAASSEAPRMLWPGAGTGSARDALLRAHPLLEDGVLTGAAFGRRLLHASLEVSRPLWSVGPVHLSAAVFLDAARVRLRPGSASYLDAGAGLRLHGLGASTLRLDAAWGIADGASAVSIGWQPF